MNEEIKLKDKTETLLDLSTEVFNELRDDFESFLSQDINEEELTKEVFYFVNRFYCEDYTLSDTEALIEQIMSDLQDDPDRCSQCLKIIQEGNYETEEQNHPYGEGSASETISTGYVCNNCGNRESF